MKSVLRQNTRATAADLKPLTLPNHEILSARENLYDQSASICEICGHLILP